MREALAASTASRLIKPGFGWLRRAALRYCDVQLRGLRARRFVYKFTMDAVDGRELCALPESVPTADILFVPLLRFFTTSFDGSRHLRAPDSHVNIGCLLCRSARFWFFSQPYSQNMIFAQHVAVRQRAGFAREDASSRFARSFCGFPKSAALYVTTALGTWCYHVVALTSAAQTSPPTRSDSYRLTA